MATFNLELGVISRRAGHSATHEAAYVTGSVVMDERTKTTTDFSRKRGVLRSAIIGPVNMDASSFSNALEKAENRKNSVTARTLNVALPEELDDQARWNLLIRLGTHLCEEHGVGILAAQHAPPRDAWSSGRNHHGHLMFSTRVMDDTGNLKKKHGDGTRKLPVRSSSPNSGRFGPRSAMKPWPLLGATPESIIAVSSPVETTDRQESI